MFDSFLVNALILLHFLFVVFVIFGGLLILWSKKIALVHIPAAIWGTVIEFTGWICPLTPLENELRYKAGRTTYSGGFIENCILPILYPDGLTHNIQFILGSLVIITNITIYWIVLKKQ